MRARVDETEAPAPWLVDGFAGADLQRAAMRGATMQPPAVAFAHAAAEAFGDAARVLLVDEDPGLLARLDAELRGAGVHPRRASDVSDVAAGEIVLVEAAFASIASRLAGETADAPALVRLAPLSARALPWASLDPMASLPGADLLIRFPREDFARAGGFSGPLADFPPHLRRVAEGCSAFFADERHAWLLGWREAVRAGGDEAALAAMVERLRGMLGTGEERIARAARVEGAENSAVHLLLSTPHAEHALELNGAAMDGGASPAAPSPAGRSTRRSASARTSPGTGAAVESPAPSTAASVSPADPQPPAAEGFATPVDAPPLLDLFAPEPVAAAELPRGLDLRTIAEDLHARYAGRRVAFRALLVDLADAGLAPEQVRTALGLLKRDRRAAYRSLDADGAEVDFFTEPAPPPPSAGPKPRKAPRPIPGVLGLFDELEADPTTPAAIGDETHPSTPADSPIEEASASSRPTRRSKRRKSGEAE